MTVQCIECSNWRPRETEGRMAAVGYAFCKVLSTSAAQTFAGIFKRECAKFKKAADDVIEARRKFEDKRP